MAHTVCGQVESAVACFDVEPDASVSSAVSSLGARFREDSHLLETERIH